MNANDWKALTSSNPARHTYFVMYSPLVRRVPTTPSGYAFVDACADLGTCINLHNWATITAWAIELTSCSEEITESGRNYN